MSSPVTDVMTRYSERMSPRTDPATAQAIGSRRDRLRASTIDEIKTTARRLMAESGTLEARFTDIAREMGMTAPGLYRYFRDRDELLTALISDGYGSLADAIADAVAASRAVAPAGVWEQFVAVANGYRAWAAADPARYALVFGMPIAGYAAPEHGNTTTDARRAMAALIGVLTDGADQLGPRAVVGAPTLDEQLAAVLPDVPVQRHQLAMHAWMSLHGCVSLEVFGHFSMLSTEARDELFTAQVGLIGRTLGLPVPDRREGP
jgi:AcrR family transcriptional regulator